MGSASPGVVTPSAIFVGHLQQLCSHPEKRRSHQPVLFQVLGVQRPCSLGVGELLGQQALVSWHTVGAK